MVRNKLIAALGFVAAVVAGPAFAVGTGVDFKVNESVVTGVPLGSPIITADSFDFSYAAVINQSLVGASLDGNDPFTESGSIRASSFKNGIATQPAFLNSPAAVGGYGLVGSFNATGLAGVVGAGIKAIFSTFILDLYIDTDQNGTGDILLGTATQNAYSEANIFGGLANGDFDVNLLFTPTAFGSTYFIDPVPFVLNMEVTGNTTTIVGASLGAFVANVDGSGNAFVNPIPEPASLGLVGVALVALGMSRRRRKTVG